MKETEGNSSTYFFLDEPSIKAGLLAAANLPEWSEGSRCMQQPRVVANGYKPTTFVGYPSELGFWS